MTLKHALEILGYGPCYHMIELTNHPDKAKFWLKAANGHPVNWEAIFSTYHSVTDFPGCLYYRELLQYYPNARVILTEREANSWYDSARNTIFKSYPSFAQALYILSNYLFSKRVRQLMQVGWLIQKTIFYQTFGMRQFNKRHAMEVFQKHSARVKAYVPKNRLLVYNVQEGWEPLCSFLNVPVPEVPFPKTNRGDHFHKMKKVTLKSPVDDAMKQG